MIDRPAPGELVVVTAEEGASAFLGRLASAWPDAVLLEAPPGTDWRPDDVAGEVVDAADLAALGMHLPERPLRAMSSGERQRVRLARALREPGLLLLDEPTGYLDAAGSRLLVQRLQGRAAVVAAVADPVVQAAATTLLAVLPQ